MAASVEQRVTTAVVVMAAVAVGAYLCASVFAPLVLMTGLNAIGGTVNYVSRQPISGPIQNEADFSVDTFGSVVSHYGSGGNTGVKGLDYRFDMAGSQLNSFIDGDFREGKCTFFIDPSSSPIDGVTVIAPGNVRFWRQGGHERLKSPCSPALAVPNSSLGR
jgi:iron complex outermembrane recepter protein